MPAKWPPSFQEVSLWPRLAVAEILMLLPAYIAYVVIPLQASGDDISCPGPAEDLGIFWDGFCALLQV